MKRKYEIPDIKIIKFECDPYILNENETFNGDEVFHGGESEPSVTVEDLPIGW